MSGFIPGHRFVRGALLVFRPDEVLRVQGWPGLAGARRDAAGTRWWPCVPWLRLVRPYRPAPPTPQLALPIGAAAVPEADARARAYAAFRGTVPAGVARAVEPFLGEQWHLLRLARDAPDLVDVLGTTPVLGFALAVADRLVDAPPDLAEVRQLLRRPQTVLADRLGLPATAAARRVLAKVDPACVDPARVDELRAAIARPGVLARLGHLDRVHAGVIGLVADEALLARVHASLLAEVAARPEERLRPRTAERLARILSMAAALDHRLPGRPFRSVAELGALHDALAERWIASTDPSSPERFGPPPVPGIEGIAPIEDELALREEGRRQHHCVGSYADAVRRGAVYVYRVTRPERATLSIARGPDGTWRRSELTGDFNREVGAATVAAVDAWLSGWAA